MQTEIAHAYGFKYMAEHIPAMAKVALENTSIIFGVGIIENAYDRPAKIVTVPNEKILIEEPALLEESKLMMPRIMFDPIDVLVVDEMGKDISGDGMDPIIIGRYLTPYASGGPQVSRIVVLGLTDRSHGNACGIGLADITTRKVFEEIIWEKGFTNVITSTLVGGAKFPVFVDTAELATKVAVKTSNVVDLSNVRLIRIKNTLHLKEIWISENLIDEAAKNENIDILSKPTEMKWNLEFPSNQGQILPGIK